MHVALIGDYPRDENTIGGGVESVMLFLAAGLSAFDDTVIDVVTLDRWGLGERVEQHGAVRLHYLEASKRPGRIGHRDNIQCMREKLVQLEPDIVHAHIAGKYSAAAAQSGRPWLLTLHGIRYLEAQLRTGWRERLYKNALIRREELKGVREAGFLVSISPFIQASFGTNIRGTVYDIENPIADIYFDLQARPVPKQFLYVGRLTKRKGLDVLLKAFKELHTRFPDATLRLAGKCDTDDADPYCESMHRYVEDQGIGEAVNFLGQLNEKELHREYESCTALVLTAVLETAPMAIAQAMAAGVPVVSTDAGGSRYLVSTGENGFIVPINDARACSEAMGRLAEDPQLANKMGQRAREKAEQRFRVRSVAERTRAVYQEILRKNP